jgi:hypothetical protein
MKRMVIISDLHGGHEYGLCGPSWWRSGKGKVAKTGRFQRELWRFYTAALDSLKPIYLLGVNGDAVEGKNEESGGTELITSDRHDQARIAAEAIEYAEAEHIRLVYGTKRHVGREEDFEATLVDLLKPKDIKIQSHAFFRIGGVSVDMKHKVASSSIPHGRLTAIARARLWNVIWHSEQERQPKADIIIRSHVHYFNYAGGASWLALSTPALTYNSIFGVRECEGLVDVGLVVFDFDEQGGYTWRPIIADFKDLQVRPESL